MRKLYYVFILAMTVRQALGYSTGPLDDHAGNPPARNNCTECHDSFQLNSGNGAITVTGLPDFYFPGATYSIQLQLEQTGQRRWGFELTTIQQSSNLQGGTLLVTSPTFTQLSEGTGTAPDFLKHTATGTFNNSSNGPVFWNFAWTAPAAGFDSIGVYLAMNAANGDETNQGDYIYTRSFIIPEAATPAPVTSLSIMPQANAVALNWNPSTGANLYFVKRMANPYETTPEVTYANVVTTFIDTVNFAVEPERYYRVSAVRGTKLSTRVQGIFNQNCVSCHLSGFPSGDMDLSGNSAYANTVNVETAGYPGNIRVVPYDTTSSVLWHKINHTGTFGDGMPLGAPMLSPIDRADIARWIAEGAVNY